MGIDLNFLRAQCEHTLERSDLPDLGERIEGKVRDSYVSGKRRTIVVSDRVSCFDVVVGTLPSKGQVLNQIAAFWFEKTRGLAKNHLLEVPDPNVSIVQECRLLPVEFVFRAHLTGSTSTSIWTAYDRGERAYCGHTLPDGMKKHEEFPAPLLTPTTKAPMGEHDELTSRDEILERGTMSEELFDAAAALLGGLFAEGRKWAASRGLILADTKYELGLDDDGNLVVIDEIHTPDSSRYWYRESFERAMSNGTDPESLDKEYVRRWLLEQGYRGDGPSPEIPVEVKVEAARRYIETYEQITGQAFVPVDDTGDPHDRIRRNLGL